MVHDTDGTDVSVGLAPVPVVIAGLTQRAFRHTNRPPMAERSVLTRQSWFVTQETDGIDVSVGSTPVPVVTAGLTHRAFRHTKRPPSAERSVFTTQS